MREEQEDEYDDDDDDDDMDIFTWNQFVKITYRHSVHITHFETCTSQIFKKISSTWKQKMIPRMNLKLTSQKAPLIRGKYE